MAKTKPNWPARTRAIVAHHGWERRELARVTGASERTVEAWFSGRHTPDKRSRKILRELWEEAKDDEGAGEGSEADALAQ